MTLFHLLHFTNETYDRKTEFYVNLFSKGVNDSGKLVTSDKVTNDKKVMKSDGISIINLLIYYIY
jgi:hypothetical protein